MPPNSRLTYTWSISYTQFISELIFAGLLSRDKSLQLEVVFRFAQSGNEKTKNVMKNFSQFIVIVYYVMI